MIPDVIARSISVSKVAGSVSGEFIVPERMRFLYVFAHGAGAGMHHPFMERLAATLADARIGTLRFNFPYMENGRRRPDVPQVAEDTVRAAIATAGEAYPSVPLLAGGKSFGGRMTSQALARAHMEAVKGIVFTGFPLHPAGKPATDRAAHLAAVRVPMLFLQGTRDALADLALIEGVCRTLPGATLEKIQGADHSFKAGKQDLIPLLAESISRWTEALAEG